MTIYIAFLRGINVGGKNMIKMAELKRAFESIGLCEVLTINGREVYLLFRQSIRNSKLANNLQKLDVSATVRNWKTINKIVVLTKTMGGYYHDI